MGCFDIFCTLCGGPLNRSELWDSLRSPDPEPGGMYWDYNQELLREEDTEVSLRSTLLPIPTVTPRNPIHVLVCFNILPMIKTFVRSLIQAQWLEDIRFIAEWQSKTDQEKNTRVAAETFFSSEFDSCMGPLDATDKNGVTHWCYPFAKYENEDQYPGNHFVMHSACLLIVKRWMFEEGKSTQDLYNALNVYPANDFIGVFLPNQHYGAEQFWEQFWIAKQRWEFVVKDPVNVPGMTQYILSKLRAVPPEEQEEGKRLATMFNKSPGATLHPFGGPSIKSLPIECLEQICAYLSSSSILSLRLSCRNLRQCIATDQAFYRQQLLSGQIFALQDLDLGLIQERWDEIKDKDWRRLVRTLARYENFNAGEGGSGELGELHDAPIGLKNRLRIIKIVQGIFSGT